MNARVIITQIISVIFMLLIIGNRVRVYLYKDILKIVIDYKII